LLETADILIYANLLPPYGAYLAKIATQCLSQLFVGCAGYWKEEGISLQSVMDLPCFQSGLSPLDAPSITAISKKYALVQGGVPPALAVDPRYKLRAVTVVTGQGHS